MALVVACRGYTRTGFLDEMMTEKEVYKVSGAPYNRAKYQRMSQPKANAAAKA